MSFDESATNGLDGNRRTLASCWLAYGVFRLVMGICLILFSGTATVMFGALLSRVPDPFTLMAIFHIAYVGFVILTFLSGLFGIVAGLALMGSQRSARTLALVAALLSVSEIPFGTTLGIYTLVVLLSSRSFSPSTRA